MVRSGRLLILFIPIYLISCERTMVPVPSDSLSRGEKVYTKAPGDAEKELSLFDCIDDEGFWSRFNSLDERFDFFQVPDSILSVLSTDVLVKYCVHYPLNSLIWSYNNPCDAIRLIYSKSSMHKELLRRPDAAEKLVELFSRSFINSSLNDPDNILSEGLSLTNEMALEYTLYSGLVSIEQKAMNKTGFGEILLDKIEMCDSVVGSSNSFLTDPLIIMYNRIFGDEKFVQASAVDTSIVMRPRGQYTTLFGHYIEYLSNEEMSPALVTYLDSLAENQYPNAQLVASSSSRYNCHSYAWVLNHVQNNKWVNRANSNNVEQLSRFWTNDLYVTTPSGAQPVNLHYENGDHSARFVSATSSNVTVISKWGMGPLMIHSLTDCPYDSSVITSYSVRTSPICTPKIYGPEVVEIGYPYYYSINFLGNSQWYLDLTNTTFTQPPYLNCYDGHNCAVTMYETGACQLYVWGYYNGNLVYEDNKLIVTSDVINPFSDEPTEGI